MTDTGSVRLSATLIVRSEADHLRRCLASIRPFIDEIIVVDTGSTDDTPGVATSFGARLFTFDWRGDFSSARNHAIEQATGQWLLYIDADECARPVDAHALKASLADPGLVASTVRFRSVTGASRYWECRLFRNDPRIRFRNVIHESMMPDIHALERDAGLRIGRSPLTIDHFGYDGNQDHKHRRNIPMLRARLAVEPDHIYSLNHLGQALAGLGDTTQATALWEGAIAVIRRRGVQLELDALPYGSVLLTQGEHPSADLLDEALRLFPHNLLFHWLRGRQLAKAGLFADAVALLEPLAALDDEFCSDEGVAYDAQIFGLPTFEMLGLCHFRLGHYAESAASYARAAHVAPSHVEFDVKRRLAEARAGRHAPNA